MIKRGDDLDNIESRVINDRILFYGFELSADHVVENDDLNSAVNEVINIMRGVVIC
jgi:guanylate kinase